MQVITIDTGTTNTRVKLWNGQTLIAEGFSPVGVRDTAVTGSTAALTAGVRDAFVQALSAGGIREADVGLVLAAGMITSNMGLRELPHIAAPAGLAELAAGMTSSVLPAVTTHPIWFVPGVKTFSGKVTLDNCDKADMMRGEEVEAFGLAGQVGLSGPAVIILPGSHTKFVQLDEHNCITGSVTSIAGELLSAITHNTLIANAVSKSFAQALEPEPFIAGAKYAQRVGLSRASFQVRLLDLFAELSTNQKANFLLGAVLTQDLAALDNSEALNISASMPLVVGGTSLIAQGLALLLQSTGRQVRLISDETMRLASGLGCIQVAAARGLIRPNSD